MTHDPNKVYYELGARPTEVVDSFVIVERDEDSHDRPAVYASGDLYPTLRTSICSIKKYRFLINPKIRIIEKKDSTNISRRKK
jgi:hypothetical protein